MSTVCGIDEAGRGPVMGPLVFAGVRLKESELSKLEELGVTDSKLLSKKKRDALYNEIISLVDDYHIVVLTPQKIDHFVLGEETSLNSLSSDTSAKIANMLGAPTVILDCPSINAAGYSAEFAKKVSVQKLICEHKADLNHTIVGAASILAKVTRDRLIEKIGARHDVETGSGYPSDPKTKAFLESHWDKLNVWRKSWMTWKNMAQKKKQTSLSGF